MVHANMNGMFGLPLIVGDLAGGLVQGHVKVDAGSVEREGSMRGEEAEEEFEVGDAEE